MLRSLPPAGSTSPGCATRYCTRPLRGALSRLSSISAWSRATLALAASMADCASITWERPASIAACAEITCERAADNAAWALCRVARSSSSCCCGRALRLTSASVRVKRFCAAVSSAWRCATTAWAVLFSLSRWATSEVAVSLAFSAWRTWAWAWANCASSTWVSIRATISPALTKSPSSTLISATRPGSLAATSTSVASMRPLPLANPSPRPVGRDTCQTSTPTPSSAATTRARLSHRLLSCFIPSPRTSGQAAAIALTLESAAAADFTGSIVPPGRRAGVDARQTRPTESHRKAESPVPRIRERGTERIVDLRAGR